MSREYNVGQVLEYLGEKEPGEKLTGTIVTPEELRRIMPWKIIMPGDVCVRWDWGGAGTYDKDVLDEKTKDKP